MAYRVLRSLKVFVLNKFRIRIIL